MLPVLQEDQDTPQGGGVGQDSGMELTLDDAGETVMDTIAGIVESFLAQLPLIVAGILILVLTVVVAWVARRVTERLLRDVKLRASLKELISRFVVITFWCNAAGSLPDS